MTVYVDAIVDWGLDMVAPAAKRHGSRWCHLAGDGTPQELDDFAHRIGLRREWRSDVTQPGAGILHYDLVPSKRVAALKAGALPLDWHDAALVARLLRQPRPESEVAS